LPDRRSGCTPPSPLSPDILVRETLRNLRERGTIGQCLRALEHLRAAALPPLQRPLLPLIVRQIRSTAHVHDVDNLISAASRQFLRAIVPIQKRSEIRGLMKAVRTLAPNRVLEIGTANGGTLFLLTRVSAPDAHVISVDLPGGPFGGDKNEWKHSIWKAFATGRQKMTLLRADSHKHETLERVRQHLDGHALDFLMIDGDHTYDGVKMDFEMYSPMVRSGGLIAFHDICPHPHGFGGEVFRYWQDVKKGRQATEFVENPATGFGIGLLRV